MYFTKEQAIELLEAADTVLDSLILKLNDIKVTVAAARATSDVSVRNALYTIFTTQLDAFDDICINGKWSSMQIWPAPVRENLAGSTYAFYETDDYTGSPHKNKFGGRMYIVQDAALDWSLLPLGENDIGSCTFYNVLLGPLTSIDEGKYSSLRNTYKPPTYHALTIPFTQMDSNAVITIEPRDPDWGRVKEVFNSFTAFTAFPPGSIDWSIGMLKNGIPFSGTINDKLELLDYLVNANNTAILANFNGGGLLNPYTVMGKTNIIGTGITRINAQKAFITEYINYLETWSEIMDTTTNVPQAKMGMISPTLRDISISTNGVYYIQNNWIIDSTTLQPVGMTHTVTLGP